MRCITPGMELPDLIWYMDDLENFEAFKVLLVLMQINRSLMEYGTSVAGYAEIEIWLPNLTPSHSIQDSTHLSACMV